MNVFLWNVRARNSHVEATLNHPFAAQVRVDESKAAERRRTKMVRETDGSRRLLEDTEATRSVRRLR